MTAHLENFAMQTTQATSHIDFEDVLIAELETLRRGEEQLKDLYPKLRVEPQLLEGFLSKLAEVRARTERLYAILDPVDAFKDDGFVGVTVPATSSFSPAA